MRALVNTRYGGPEVLEVQERPDLTPGPGEVLVQVKRAGLNFADIAARVGLYPDAPKAPMVVGYEVAGTVGALGAGAQGFQVGDRVFGITRFGGHASQVAVPAGQVKRIPGGLSFEEATALPVNYLTAYHMLFYVAPLRPGMKVLVHMSAGGVGLAVIQLCRTVPGVELFGTASGAKHAFLREAGLDHPIDYRTQDYVAEVKRLTGGRGLHRVLDPLGGEDWAKGYELLRPAGHLVCFGWANMVRGEKRSLLNVARELLSLKRFNPMGLMDKNRSVSGVNLGHMWGEEALMSSHLERLGELAEAGQVKPHVDVVVPLSRAAEAHARMQERKNVGKVVFDCDA